METVLTECIGPILNNVLGTVLNNVLGTVLNNVLGTVLTQLCIRHLSKMDTGPSITILR